MITIHTVYEISLVSQSTSALVLVLLAWIDRRSRWLVPLALACALHAGAIYLMPLWRGTGRWLPMAFSQATLIGMFYLIHLGLQSLVFPLKLRSARIHAVVVVSMLLVFALAPLRPLWCIETAPAITMVLLVWTVRTLWNARTPGLGIPLRVTAILLVAILLHFLVRLILEPQGPSSPAMLLLRKTTMLLVTMMAFSFLAIYAAESKRRLHDESRLDVLTGLPNRRAIEEAAIRQVQLAARDRTSCALLMLDLDRFKELNDTWGHNLGDRALRSAGEILLRASARVGAGTVARMGGEEFAILLSDWSVTQAYTLAEQVRKDIAAIRLREDEKEIGFTASIGVSVLQAGELDWSELLRRADGALYQAKREGRNRVALCSVAIRAALGEESSLPTYDGHR